jgi:L-histidine N-alpha-methyltransferase
LAELVEIYPQLRARGIIADFIHHLDLIERSGKQLILFFAGTIGNLHPKDEVPTFLQRLAKQVLPSDGLLIGIDLVKDVRRLEEAYNDAKGVTAAFNLNILNVINNRLDANFNTEEFEHVAFYDTDNNWIEMRLRALCDTRVDIAGCDLSLVFREGEEIKTEISCKYTRESFEETVLKSGLKVTNWYTDDEKLFALCQLEVF